MYHSQPWFNLNVPWPARVYKICTLEFAFEVRWFHGTCALSAYSAYAYMNSVSLQDKQLDKEEILEHHDVFVGSQATNYGDYLYKHDEF